MANTWEQAPLPFQTVDMTGTIIDTTVETFTAAQKGFYNLRENIKIVNFTGPPFGVTQRFYDVTNSWELGVVTDTQVRQDAVTMLHAQLNQLELSEETEIRHNVYPRSCGTADIWRKLSIELVC